MLMSVLILMVDVNTSAPTPRVYVVTNAHVAMATFSNITVLISDLSYYV